MGHLMKYRLKEMLRQKDLVFWALVFPLIMATLFFFAFSNGSKAEGFQKISVATVTNSTRKDTYFDAFLHQMDGNYIKIVTTKEKKAKELLKSGEIKGIFYNQKELKLAVSSSGMEESILETFLDTYNKNRQLIMNVAKEHPEKVQDVVLSMSQNQNLVKNTSLGGKTFDEFLQYYFALIGMACMFGAFLGMQNSTDFQANLSQLAARRCVAPVNRLKLIVSDMLVAFGIHFINVMILLVYLRFVLQVAIGNQWPQIILVSLFGSMIGVCFGVFVGAIGRVSEGAKVGMLVGFSLLASFLSGLMVGSMKNIVEQHAPILNRINPSALITDAFYSISVYADTGRYMKDLVSMILISVILLGLSFLMVRRERYDSI